MAQINLGRIGIVPKGEWNNIFTYNRLDLVAYAGGGYVSLVDNNNNKLPTDTAYWLQISEKGETGNIDNLEDWHIVDALGYTPANKSVVDAHLAESATDADGAHGFKTESGNWSPVIIGNSGGTATMDTNSVGTYKRQGDLVTVFFLAVITDKGTISSGSIAIEGLPFAIYGATVTDLPSVSMLSTNGAVFPANVVGINTSTSRNTTKLTLHYQKNDGTANIVINISTISTTFSIRGSMTYKIA
jgi:hypothetical protein